MDVRTLPPLLFMLVFCLSVARANDANSHGVGGRWQMLKGEHKQVQMVREHVRIVPFGYAFQTTADFVFRNHGPAIAVQMGFPESEDGVDAEGPEALAYFRTRPTFSHFRSWIDGRPARVRRHVSADARIRIRALWVKTVRFKRNQTRHVRVRYISDSGGGDSSGNQWVSYQFTGGNWYGEVEESILDVKLLPLSYALPLAPSEGLRRTDMRRWQSKRQLRFRWTHWQAQKDFEFYYRPLFPSDFIRPSSHFLISPNPRPSYYSHGHSVLSWVFTTPDTVLHQGRLWVAARRFMPRWSEKQHGAWLCSNHKILFVSARGATRRSSLWPLAPNGTFWLASARGNELMVPARQLAKGFGGHFELDVNKSRATFVQGRHRLFLSGNPIS